MKKIYFSFVLACFSIINLHGQAGVLDASFGTGGIVNTSFGIQFADEINDIAIQTDGKIVAVGVTNDPGFVFDKISLARYNVNGSLDLTFGTNGLVTTTVFANFDCRGIAVEIQTDGKILVAADANDTATLTPQNGYNMVLRYDANGILDNTFGTNGIKSIQSTSTFSTEVYTTDMLLQPDGNIVLSGFADYTASGQFIFIRLTPTGAMDNTFGSSGVAVITSTIGSAIPEAMALQTDGKIVYSGFIDGTTTNYPMVGRLNANGTADASFGALGHALPSFTASAGFFGVTLESGGNIVACGFGNDGALIERFLTTGGVDASFGTSGYYITQIGTQQDAMLYDIKVQNDGKITAVGYADNAFALMRVTAQGTIDPSFGTNGITQTSLTTGVTAEARAIKIQGDGKIVLGGENTTANVNAVSMYALARYDNDVTTALIDYTTNENDFIYPNPADKQLSFQFSNKQEDITIEIYNISGELVMNENITSFNSKLNISQLPEGLYIVSVKDKTKTSFQKLVIAH